MNRRKPAAVDRRTVQRRNAIIGVLAEQGPLSVTGICLAVPIDLRRLALAESDLEYLERTGRVVSTLELSPTAVHWDEPTTPARVRMWRLPTDAERRAWHKTAETTRDENGSAP